MPSELRSIVTGAASGIGKAVFTQLVQRGDRVVGIDVQSGSDWLVADLAQETERLRVMEEAIAQLGGLDVLVNVAGIYRPTPILESSIADLRGVWKVNLEAPIELMSLALREMNKQDFGRVVNVTSVHSRFSRKDCLAYDVAKAGLEAATRSAALTGADFQVLVNAVAPGFVRTQMSLNEDGVDEADTEDFRRDFISRGRLPQMRAAHPEEIAKAVAWLASRDNTYTTGQTITVDGGLTITF